MTNGRPDTIIYTYMRDKDFVYLHIPKRFVKQCGFVSGQRLLLFVRNGKLALEQEQEVENGSFVGNSFTETK